MDFQPPPRAVGTHHLYPSVHPTIQSCRMITSISTHNHAHIVGKAAAMLSRGADFVVRMTVTPFTQHWAYLDHGYPRIDPKIGSPAEAARKDINGNPVSRSELDYDFSPPIEPYQGVVGNQPMPRWTAANSRTNQPHPRLQKWVIVGDRSHLRRNELLWTKKSGGSFVMLRSCHWQAPIPLCCQGKKLGGW
ncbi:hypothetical protein K449DRAFT_440096 [Hypoxylon sp. EC38]|nr:hypothetical protein K449DRAFT_440096 [Hypoxylon sp. EC38]